MGVAAGGDWWENAICCCLIRPHKDVPQRNDVIFPPSPGGTRQCMGAAAGGLQVLSADRTHGAHPDNSPGRVFKMPLVVGDVPHARAACYWRITLVLAEGFSYVEMNASR
jgi:hypothetical protein